jgi:heat shock protein HtpX
MINFWEAQRKARSNTKFYVAAFLAMTVVVAVITEFSFREIFPEMKKESIPYLGLLFFGITCVVALYQYAMFQTYGGSYVAESVGARQVAVDTMNPKERVLLNIVQEIAIASSLPVPPVYIIDSEAINAFAAGLSPQTAAIAVTYGTLEKLSRDELQGVVAHEFGHIYNGDMVISLRLAALVMGFFFVLYFGMRALQFTANSSRREKGGKGGNPLLVGALLLMVAGVFTWLFGSILKAAVSREREYLADACAVQFTRDTTGIAGALRKIAKETETKMPPQGMAISHMYLDNHMGFNALFATHPPLEKRIEAIEKGRYTF